MYCYDGKTLQQIGDFFGYTRERIRQKMVEWGIPRNTKRNGGKNVYSRKDKPTRLNEYFNRVKKSGKEVKPTLHRNLPIEICQDCGSKEYLHIHHLKYPATSLVDLQILCASCHMTRHRKGIDYTKQLEICTKYSGGLDGTQLAKEYDVNPATIYHILHRRNVETRKAFYRGTSN
jgi:hypothetical protein